MRTLTTAAEVVEVLGGPAEVAVLTRRGNTAAYNWKNFFPPNTYVVMQGALAEKGCAAPPNLWGMVVREREPEARVS